MARGTASGCRWVGARECPPSPASLFYSPGCDVATLPLSPRRGLQACHFFLLTFSSCCPCGSRVQCLPTVYSVGAAALPRVCVRGVLCGMRAACVCRCGGPLFLFPPHAWCLGAGGSPGTRATTVACMRSLSLAAALHPPLARAVGHSDGPARRSQQRLLLLGRKPACRLLHREVATRASQV